MPVVVLVHKSIGFFYMFYEDICWLNWTWPGWWRRGQFDNPLSSCRMGDSGVRRGGGIMEEMEGFVTERRRRRRRSMNQATDDLHG